MSTPRILVAGIGNIFLGDDAFGCEVVKRLAAKKLPRGVKVVDYGIRGLDLAYALIDDCDAAILIDAVSRGGNPGTLYLLEPEIPEGDDTVVNGHGLDPVSVLKLVRSLGGQVKGLRLVACEPENLGTEEEMVMGLSPAVESAVEPAADMVRNMVTQMLTGGRRDA